MLKFIERLWRELKTAILTFLGWLGIIRPVEELLPKPEEPLPEMPEEQQPPEESEKEELPLEPKPEPDPDLPGPLPEESETEEESPADSLPIAGKGMWIWRLVMAEDGNIARIIERAKSTGLRWVAIKGGDGSSWWSQLTKTVVQEIQNSGLKVFGWVYTYGTNPENEAAVAIHVLDLGCDGLIVDAEREYEGKPRVAEDYMRVIRAAHPSAFIAYTTFPLISLHPTFPYIEFGRYCDASMPQCYWKDIGLGPREMVRRTREEWTNWAKDLRNSGLEQSVVPLFPIGQGYRVTGDEITEFVEATAGYAGISLWVWNEMTREMWDAFAGRPKRAEFTTSSIDLSENKTDSQEEQGEEKTSEETPDEVLIKEPETPFEDETPTEGGTLADSEEIQIEDESVKTEVEASNAPDSEAESGENLSPVEDWKNSELHDEKLNPIQEGDVEEGSKRVEEKAQD